MARLFHRHRYCFLLLALAVFLPFGCKSAPKPDPAAASKATATDEQIFIGDTVEKNYDPNVIIKRAEAFFDREEYAESIIEYQHFLDLHRGHTLASYAQFKLGESHFKMVRTIDRDSEPVHKALEAYEKLLKDYPGNKYQAEAKARVHECQDFLAQANYFVGKFYYRREAYLAAAHRFESIVKQYPDMEVASDAMYDLAKTYHDIGADDWAQEKLYALEQQYPNHKHKADSQRLYAALKVTQPTALAKASAPAPPAPTPAAALISGTGEAKAVVASDLAANTLASSNGATASSATTLAGQSGAFSDSPRRANTAVAPPPPQRVVTLASAKAPTPPQAQTLRAPAETPTTASAAFLPQTTLCRLGAWC
jgi:outer membrane protein assembly factor BamD